MKKMRLVEEGKMLAALLGAAFSGAIVGGAFVWLVTKMI